MRFLLAKVNAWAVAATTSQLLISSTANWSINESSDENWVSTLQGTPAREVCVINPAALCCANVWRYIFKGVAAVFCLDAQSFVCFLRWLKPMCPVCIKKAACMDAQMFPCVAGSSWQKDLLVEMGCFLCGCRQKIKSIRRKPLSSACSCKQGADHRTRTLTSV